MNSADQKRIRKKLSKDNVCYVLITCALPSDDGNMQVEMTYEGDAALASYLLVGAQSLIDEHIDEESGNFQSKVISITG